MVQTIYILEGVKMMEQVKETAAVTPDETIWDTLKREILSLTDEQTELLIQRLQEIEWE